MKKVVVTNFCGGVGKTTLSARLLYPRLQIESGNVFCFDTLNNGLVEEGVQAEVVHDHQLAEVIDRIMLSDSALFDVGHSNVQAFFKGMERMKGVQEEFDYFIVPCTDDKHAKDETTKAVLALNALGVKKSKIRVIPNQVSDSSIDVESTFAELFALADANYATVSKSFAVYHSDAYEGLSNLKLSIEEVLSDPIDYRADLKSVAGTDKEAYYRQRILLKRLVGPVKDNLDEVFLALKLK